MDVPGTGYYFTVCEDGMWVFAPKRNVGYQEALDEAIIRWKSGDYESVVVSEEVFGSVAWRNGEFVGEDD